MIISGAPHTGLTGISRNIARFERTVDRIARTSPLGNLPRDMVELMTSRRGVEASAATVRAADEMVGTLLDILA